MQIQGGGHKGSDLAGMVANRMELAAKAEAQQDWATAASCYAVIEAWIHECKMISFGKAVA